MTTKQTETKFSTKTIDGVSQTIFYKNKEQFTLKVLQYKKGHNNYNLKTIFYCNDGNKYITKVLAKICNISDNTLRSRINRHGWQHDNLLSGTAPKGKDIDGKTILTVHKKEATNLGSEEWQSLRKDNRAPKIMPNNGKYDDIYFKRRPAGTGEVDDYV